MRLRAPFSVKRSSAAGRIPAAEAYRVSSIHERLEVVGLEVTEGGTQDAAAAVIIKHRIVVGVARAGEIRFLELAETGPKYAAASVHVAVEGMEVVRHA